MARSKVLLARLSDYIGAYVAGLKAEVVASVPCFLFIEITPTTSTAQLVTIRLEDTKRIRVPVRVEATTYMSTTTLPTFVGQVVAWAQGHNHKLFQGVLLDPPSGSVDGTAMQTALPPDCPIIVADGAQLAKYAASYAFLNLEYLRQPDEGDDMGQYVIPSPISFMANNGPPTLIIHRSIPFTKSYSRHQKRTRRVLSLNLRLERTMHARTTG